MMADQDETDSSSEFFDEFGDDFDTESDAVESGIPRKKNKQQKKKAAVGEKDSDEEALELLVLGNKDAFRERLFRDDFAPDDSHALVRVAGGTDEADGEGSGQENLADSALFFIDAPQAGFKPPLAAEPAAQQHTADDDAPAWQASDDDRLVVSLAGHTRLRKLRDTEADDVVTGTEYARRLRRQYLSLYPAPAWAEYTTSRRMRTRRPTRR